MGFGVVVLHNARNFADLTAWSRFQGGTVMECCPQYMYYAGTDVVTVLSTQAEYS